MRIVRYKWNSCNEKIIFFFFSKESHRRRIAFFTLKSTLLLRCENIKKNNFQMSVIIVLINTGSKLLVEMKKKTLIIGFGVQYG